MGIKKERVGGLDYRAPKGDLGGKIKCAGKRIEKPGEIAENHLRR